MIAGSPTHLRMYTHLPPSPYWQCAYPPLFLIPPLPLSPEGPATQEKSEGDARHKVTPLGKTTALGTFMRSGEPRGLGKMQAGSEITFHLILSGCRFDIGDTRGFTGCRAYPQALLNRIMPNMIQFSILSALASRPSTSAPSSDLTIAIMDSDEHSEYALFGAQEDNYDLFVEVKVDGSREVHHTMSMETAHWDQNLRMIEIKSVAHNSSESLSIARTDTSLGNLLEGCADGDAALELTIAPLMPDRRGQVTVSDVGNGPKHLTTDSMGIITVKLSRPPHNPPSLPQLSNTYTKPTPQTGDLEEVVTAVEAAPPPQGSNVGSLVASLQESEQLGTENLVSTKAAVDSNTRSNFLLFVGAAEWTRDPGAREDSYDLFVEVKVDGTSKVYRTMHTKTANWDEYLKITGYFSSTVRIDIKSVAHNRSESLSVVRVETSLVNLLEICADGDQRS
ncbi:hypothetical protein FIBSPDRAFT_895234 [Athelia psychrophila]|uniref:Uncharacterized protein n=1 Tax=Athelia psychrophila TaxID=1759441 RepID=A0A166EWM6_9AGAM|nr:hypothetical protein FIBSPDRAFT_895234 [Fibularhizoctonia sp. CBS 109695]